MRSLITILLLGLFIPSEAQNISQSQVRQFNAVPAYRVFGRGSGVGSPSFIQLDSNHIPVLHSQGYYDLRYDLKSAGDSLAYRAATSINDSTASLNRLNGTKTVIRIIGGSSSNPLTTSQAAYTVLGNNTGSSTTPSFSQVHVRSINATGSTYDGTKYLADDGTWKVISGGTGSGVTTMAAIGSSPNANGATISSTTLNLQPASASFGGVVTTTAQTIAGDKTFTGNTYASGYNAAGYKLRIGDMAIQPSALGNSFLMDNSQYSSGWTRLNTGYTSGFQFYNGQVLFNHANTGSGTFTPVLSFKTDYLGAVALGGTAITATNGSYTGATMVVNTTGATLTGVYRLSALNTAPTSATDTGALGEIRVTAGFIYVCIATNTWVRTTLTTF